jgi:hypothetical protein
MKIQKSKAATNFEVQILVQGQKYWDEEMTTNEYGHCVATGVERYTADKIFKTLKLATLDIEMIKNFIVKIFNYRKSEDNQIENIEFDANVDDIAKVIEDKGEYSEKVDSVNVIVPFVDRRRMYRNFIGCKWRDMVNVKVKESELTLD